MKYLFLLYGEPIPPAGTPEAAKLLEDWTAARQGMEEAGVLIACGWVREWQVFGDVGRADGG